MDDSDASNDEEWGPLVRPYAVTRGRTSTSQLDLQMTTLVLVQQHADPLAAAGLDYEHRQILAWCQRPLSIAEISSHLQLPLSVVKILIADLVERNLLIFRSAVTPDVRVLMAVINGIRQL
jgi:DNA-binding MarR family transcriptional regulator